MKYVKPAGFGLFLIPTNILETEQSEFFKMVDKRLFTRNDTVT